MGGVVYEEYIGGDLLFSGKEYELRDKLVPWELKNDQVDPYSKRITVTADDSTIPFADTKKTVRLSGLLLAHSEAGFLSLLPNRVNQADVDAAVI